MLVFLELTTSGADDLLGGIGQAVRLILAFVIVIFLAYYVTRFLGASGRLGRVKGSNLRILEGLSVGQQNNVQLVRAGKRYFLLGVSKERVTLLTELGEDDIDATVYEQAQASPALPFDKVLGRLYKPRTPKEEEEANDDDACQDR